MWFQQTSSALQLLTAFLGTQDLNLLGTFEGLAEVTASPLTWNGLGAIQVDWGTMSALYIIPFLT